MYLKYKQIPNIQYQAFLKPFSSKDVQDMLLNKAIYKT